MNPRVCAVVGAGVEGHRVPDRQDRRQARRRLHARRDPERHHQEDAGQLRAGHRLRRHQGARGGPSRSSPAPPACSARRCSRSARRWRSAARSPSRCRRRCAPSSTAGPGSTATGPRPPSTRSPTTSWSRRASIAHARPARSSSRRRCGGASRIERVAGGHEGRPVVPRPDRPDRRRARPPRRGRLRRDDAAVVAAGQAARLRRRPAGLPVGGARGRGARAPGSPPASRPRSRPSTPARRSSRPRRRTTTRPTRTRTRCAPSDRREGHHPRVGPEPHRPGHRVRLLLRPRRLRPARRRLRDDHGQLQPRDRVDRLRHLRPPLLRADHPRGRAQRHRRRAAVRRPARRHRLPRRPDAR